MVVFIYWPANSQPPILVSSYFNSNSPETEWTELLVVQDGLSLSGWKLRDYDNANNVWNSDIVFTDNALWSQLRAGTIIVINHRDGMLTDLLKSDGFIRVSAKNSNFLIGQIANSFSINGDSDAIEIRNPQGQHIHSLSHAAIQGDHISAISTNKIHFQNTLPIGKALIVSPGGSIVEFGCPNPYVDTNHSQITSNKTPGIPCTTCSESSDFWRVNRHPVWNNPSGWFEEVDSTINWNDQTNIQTVTPYQGYLILKNSENSFDSPVDGRFYDTINGLTMVGSASVVANSVTNSYELKNLVLDCNETVYFRIYGYRFSQDNYGSQELVRGRAYNETAFASISITNHPVNVETTIDVSPSGIIPQGTSVVCSLNLSYALIDPEIKWFINDDPNPVQTGGTTFEFVPENNDTLKVTVVPAGSICTTGPVEEFVVFEVEECQIPIILSPDPNQEFEICSGEQFEIELNSNQPEAEFSWTVQDSLSNSSVTGYSNGTGNQISQTISNTSFEEGILSYKIKANIGVCESEEIFVYVHVKPKPHLVNQIEDHCSGTQINFSPQSTIGGTTFSWIRDQITGIIPTSGTGQGNISEILTNQTTNVIQVEYDYSLSSNGCQNTQTVTVSILPQLINTATLFVSEDTICQDESVTFSLDTINAGSNPSINWFKNNVIFQTGDITIVDNPGDGDTYYATVVSTIFCPTSTPATSFTQTIHARPNVEAVVSLSSIPESICSGNAITLVADTLNAGKQPIIKWYKNDQLWSEVPNTFSYSYLGVYGDSFEVELISSKPCVLNDTVMSDSFTPNILQAAIAPTSLVSDRNNYCANEGGSITLNANGGAGDVVKWYGGICGGTLLHTGATYTLPAPAVSTSFYARWVTASCGFSDCKTITINVLPSITPTINIAATTNTICSGENIVFTATATETGPATLYQWKVNGSIEQNSIANVYASSLLQNNAVVSCTLLGDNACATVSSVTSNEINITVHPFADVSVDVNASQNDVCISESVQFTATPQNGGSNPSYTWFVNDFVVGTNADTYIYSPAIGDKVQVILQSSVPYCTINNPATSAPVFPSVHPNPVAPAEVTASDMNVCPGESGTITLTGNGGLGDVLLWYANSCGGGAPLGEGSSIQVPVPAATTTYFARFETTFCGESACVPITVTVSESLQPTVQLQVSNTEPCQGEQLTITTEVTGQGDSPVYAWLLNGSPTGSNQPTYVFVPEDGNQLECIMTSSESCADPEWASGSYTFSVSPVVVPAISVNPSANGVCEGTEVVFEAVIANGGALPVYQWMINGAPQGSNNNIFQYSPSNGDEVRCELSSDVHCASPQQVVSPTVVMTVHPVLTAEISISADQTSICLGESVQLQSSVQNQGLNPVYEWLVNGTSVGNAASYTFQPADQDMVQCMLTSSENCLTGNPAFSNTITITAAAQLTPSIAISTPTTIVCEGTTVIVESTFENGGAQPTYQWFANGSEVSTDAILQFAPTDGAVVYCVMTSNAGCLTAPSATSGTIVFDVEAVELTSITISANQLELCAGSTAVANAEYTGGGDSPLFEWFIDGQAQTGNDASFSFTPQTNAVLQCRMTSSAMCPSTTVSISNDLNFSVLPQVSPAVSLFAPIGTICAGDQIIIQTNYSGSGDQPVFDWMVNGSPIGSNQAMIVLTPDNQDEVVCVMTSNALCTLQSVVSSETLTLTVNDIVVPVISIEGGQGNLCPDTEISLNALPEGGGDQPLFTWFRNDQEIGSTTSVNVIPETGDVIRCVMVSSATCANPSDAQATMFPQVSSPITLFVDNLVPSSCNENNGAFLVQATGGISPLSYSIDNGQNWQQLNDFNGLSAGIYQLKATDSWGCSLSSSLEIEIESIPPLIINELILTKSRANVAEGIAEVLVTEPLNCIFSLDAINWQSQNQFSNLSPGIYTVFVRDDFGCTSQQDFEILIQFIDFEPGIPNAFRPASLPPNNIFKPVFGPIIPIHYQMVIFNRWGDVVFETEDYTVGWDGIYNGNEASQGSYVYKIVFSYSSFESTNEFNFTRTGSILLIR